MDDLHKFLRWWEKESQKDLHPTIQEFGRRMIKAQIRYEKRRKEQAEKSFQREQQLFSRIERFRTRMKTLEERVEILIEMEVEEQKIVFSKQVDKLAEGQRKTFLEATDKMLQSFQNALRAPKGGDTLPNKK